MSSQSIVQAHGIGANAADSEAWEFIQFGFEHMLLGWDHLLFIAGVIIVCRNWWLAAKMITIFVVGHSATLILASGLGWGVDPTLVDFIIAVSVLFVGGWALAGRPADLKIFGSVVLGFGLIHGLGLAARLDEVGLPSGSYLKVIAFNLGIELGQLTAVLAFAALTYVGAKLVSAKDTARQVLSGGVIAGGVLACVVVLLAIVNPPLGEPTRLALSDGSSCELTERTREFGSIGKHPNNIFTEPGDEAPMDDFGHTMGDGFVIVLYPEDLPTADLDTLRGYVTSEEGEFVLAGPDPVASDKIAVHNLYETLTCDKLELETLVEYRDVWIKSVEEDLA